MDEVKVYDEKSYSRLGAWMSEYTDISCAVAHDNQCLLRVDIYRVDISLFGFLTMPHPTHPIGQHTLISAPPYVTELFCPIQAHHGVTVPCNHTNTGASCPM